jgi:chemotaxis protein histidine kinase CheA/ActR/RegA family two-component response regulator
VSREQLLERFRAGSLSRVLSLRQSLAALGNDTHTGSAAEWLGELHTLKGEAKMLGLAALSAAAHAIEEKLQPLASGSAIGDAKLAECLRELAALHQALEGSLAGTSHDAQPKEPASSTRWVQVPAERVDAVCEKLIALNGEITQLQSHLAKGTKDRDRELREGIARCRTKLADVTSDAWSLRMVPVHPTLDSLARHAEALAEEHGKRMQAVVESGGVQIERGILDALWDPLLHLVRNAVDHGLEDGGTVELLAQPRGSDVELIVADDGRGVDLAQVRAVAVARGLFSAQDIATQTEEAILELLFCPGFSTRAAVTETSGRGVGLDVVRRKVEGLGGAVTLRSSFGHGSEFRLVVPAMLAQEHVLVIGVGHALYGISSRHIVNLLDERDAVRVQTLLGPRLRVGGEDLPLQRLADVLGEPNDGATRRIVIVQANGGRWAFGVSEVVGEFDLLRRSADTLVQSLGAVSASACLDDGRLVMILRTAELTRRAQRPTAQEAAAPARAVRVLVVDDSPIIRDLVREVLHGAGYEVSTAGDGEAALALVERDAPELVLSDVEMPKMGGFELLAHIRRRTDRLPVVMLTTRGSAEDRRRASSLGANAYVIKSDFEGPALLAAVERLVGHTR